nr:hypothetical protein [Kineococcus aurantiacus]
MPLAAAALATAVLSALVTSPAASAAAPVPRAPAGLPAAVDDLAAYEGATTCADVQPGTRELRDLLLTTYGRQVIGTHRACPVGAAVDSEHHEGRALDWMLDAGDPTDAATARTFLDWLLADDAANARRLGVMYVIWDGRVWKSYRAAQGWQPYAGPNPHTDHVHVSLSRRGAAAETSWWTGRTDPAEAHWVALGGTRSALGDPVAGGPRFAGASARRYENGTVLWTRDTQARAVWGAIGAAYVQRGLASAVGLPVTDEFGVPGGRANHFQRGSVYWSPRTGAHEVHGAIRDAWAARGWESGRLGFPTSDERTVGGVRRSDFQGGYVTWSAGRGVSVHTG